MDGVRLCAWVAVLVRLCWCFATADRAKVHLVHGLSKGTQRRGQGEASADALARVQFCRSCPDPSSEGSEVSGLVAAQVRAHAKHRDSPTCLVNPNRLPCIIQPPLRGGPSPWPSPWPSPCPSPSYPGPGRLARVARCRRVHATSRWRPSSYTQCPIVASGRKYSTPARSGGTSLSLIVAAKCRWSRRFSSRRQVPGRTASAELGDRAAPPPRPPSLMPPLAHRLVSCVCGSCGYIVRLS